jgi:hypothetical protein
VASSVVPVAVTEIWDGKIWEFTKSSFGGGDADECSDERVIETAIRETGRYLFIISSFTG